MSTIDRPRLVAGDRMGQPEFHERYEAMPPGLKFELIDGVVYMPSPVGSEHSFTDGTAAGWLYAYRARTPGVRIGLNGSIALDARSEVQPDSMLIILPERGGLTRNQGSILAGVPELAIEVAHSSRATDLGSKLAAYDRAGVPEYLVLAIDPEAVLWHVRLDGRLVPMPPAPDGIYRSRIFPGLWLDQVALFADDATTLLATLDQGLATAEHAAFVDRLAAARQG